VKAIAAPLRWIIEAPFENNPALAAPTIVGTGDVVGEEGGLEEELEEV